jgi:hypothetical protein
MAGCGGEHTEECNNDAHSDGDLGICDCDHHCDAMPHYLGNGVQRCIRSSTIEPAPEPVTPCPPVTKQFCEHGRINDDAGCATNDCASAPEPMNPFACMAERCDGELAVCIDADNCGQLWNIFKEEQRDYWPADEEKGAFSDLDHAAFNNLERCFYGKSCGTPPEQPEPVPEQKNPYACMAERCDGELAVCIDAGNCGQLWNIFKEEQRDYWPADEEKGAFSDLDHAAFNNLERCFYGKSCGEKEGETPTTELVLRGRVIDVLALRSDILSGVVALIDSLLHPYTSFDEHY